MLVDVNKPSTRIRTGTCGFCIYFRPPFQDLHWKGRVRRQVPGRCSARDDETRLRDQSCDLQQDGPPIGSSPSQRMSRLNQRMKRKNSAIKRRCVEGMTRVRQDPVYRAIQGAVLREIMSRPGMRAKNVRIIHSQGKAPRILATC